MSGRIEDPVDASASFQRVNFLLACKGKSAEYAIPLGSCIWRWTVGDGDFTTPCLISSGVVSLDNDEAIDNSQPSQTFAVIIRSSMSL